MSSKELSPGHEVQSLGATFIWANTLVYSPVHQPQWYMVKTH